MGKTAQATAVASKGPGIRVGAWVRLLKLVYRPLVRSAARQILEGRRIDPDSVPPDRWLRSDVKQFLRETWRRVDALVPEARLDQLPTYGNRHNVFLSVVTTAAYLALLDRGIREERAADLVADVGWKIYARMLGLAVLPYRLTRRSPQRRMELTLKALMVFPFSAPGTPGYAVKSWSDGGRFHTHWTHCPPQTFVRRLVETHGDHGELTAFHRSWCLYDWPGADVLASDGERGHYARPHTLSRGDAVCDMCWIGGNSRRRVGEDASTGLVSARGVEPRT